MAATKRPILISVEELEKKGTKELLGYLKKLRQCEETFSFDTTDYEKNPDLEDSPIIYFKDTQKWKTAYHRVKEILKTREHVNISSKYKRFERE